MKRTKNIFLSFFLLLINFSFAQQNIRHFIVSPEMAIAGEMATISYNPLGTSLQDKKDISAVIYMYCDFTWSTDDLNLVKKDSLWTGSYTLPKNCAFFACKFKAEGVEDTGKRISYGYTTTDKTTGRQLPGAYYAWGMLRNATLQKQAPSFADSSAFISDEVMLYWIKQELAYHPESRLHVFYPALTLLKKMGKDDALAKIEKELKVIPTFPDVDEPALMDVENGYRFLLGDPKRADSVKRLILNKYPKGITARDKAIYKLFRENDAEKRDSAWAQFVADFPLDKFKDVHTDITDLYYAKVYRAIVYNPILKHDNYKILEELLPTAPIECLFDFHRHIVGTVLDKKMKTADFLLPYSTMIINQINTIEKNRSLKESRFFSPKEWKAYVMNMFASAYFLHAKVLNQTANYKQAFYFAEKVKNIYGYKTAAFNGLFVELLQKNDKEGEVLPFIKNGIRENAATPEMIEILKKDYIRQNKNEKGFNVYLNSLKSKEHILAQQKALKASLIKKEIEPFKLESINGSYENLAEQKGKIVVLDFWATWCAPCKAALPGMQMAVNKYKNDPDVVFYFIATMESSPNYRQLIKDFLEEKNFSLNVLYDGLNPRTKKLDDTYSKYAKSIGFSGIPQKMIIDKNGMLRWRSTGYNGSPSELADEISYIIELLKNE